MTIVKHVTGVQRLVSLMATGRRARARAVFYRRIMPDPQIPVDDKSFLANLVGVHDEGERHLLDRKDL